MLPPINTVLYLQKPEHRSTKRIAAAHLDGDPERVREVGQRHDHLRRVGPPTARTGLRQQLSRLPGVSCLRCRPLCHGHGQEGLVAVASCLQQQPILLSMYSSDRHRFLLEPPTGPRGSQHRPRWVVNRPAEPSLPGVQIPGVILNLPVD